MPPERQPFHNLIGRYATLEIRRFGSPGAFLAERSTAEDADVLLLLGPEIPPDAREGDEVAVFVSLDSEGRPLATTKVPKLALGEVAFLTVTACTEFGAFVDWGLPKELLAPFAQQTKELRVGDAHPIGLYMDNTGRLAGTMRISELLGEGSRSFTRGEWVEGEAWRQDPEIGLFVIVERGFVGLVPKHEPHTLSRGEAARFRVTTCTRTARSSCRCALSATKSWKATARKSCNFSSAPAHPSWATNPIPNRSASFSV